MKWKLSLQNKIQSKKPFVKQFIKKYVKKLFFLPLFPTLLISIPSYALVIYVLIKQPTMKNAVTGDSFGTVSETTLYVKKVLYPILVYGSYILSAYSLIITITGIVDIIRWIRAKIKKNPLVTKALSISFISRYVREDLFRAETALYQGFAINLLYAGIKLFSGIFYHSIWFTTLAVYYVLLALMRFFLLQHMRKEEAAAKSQNQVNLTLIYSIPEANKKKASEWRRYRLCGILLLFMNVALTGMVVLVIHQNSGFEYPGALIYLMALYTFYATITAARNVIKFRKYGSPIFSAAKVINLTAAMVSMLSLETAMLTQFGSADDIRFRQLMTASTGAGVTTLVLGMAVFMIIHATKQLKT